jgi:hypothetical protein
MPPRKGRELNKVMHGEKAHGRSGSGEKAILVKEK